MFSLIKQKVVRIFVPPGMQPLVDWKRPEILNKLKGETHANHMMLQDHSAFNGLTGKAPDKKQYAWLLQKFWGLHKPLEEKLGERSEWNHLSFNFDERRKVNLLQKDVQALDAWGNDLPVCKSLPKIETFDDALGCMYVLEGSTLGGAVISRNLEKTLGIKSENGGLYYNCYGAGKELGEKFKQMAEFIGRNHKDADRVVRSANETFIAINNWLSV